MEDPQSMSFEKSSFEKFIEESIKEVALKQSFPEEPYAHSVELATDYYNSSDLRDVKISIDIMADLYPEESLENIKQEKIFEKNLPENLRDHVVASRSNANDIVAQAKERNEKARGKAKEQKQQDNNALAF